MCPLSVLTICRASSCLSCSGWPCTVIGFQVIPYSIRYVSTIIRPADYGSVAFYSFELNFKSVITKIVKV